jgi:hypothetical protein
MGFDWLFTLKKRIIRIIVGAKPKTSALIISNGHEFPEELLPSLSVSLILEPYNLKHV